MSVKKTNAKCSGCGGNLTFDPTSQNLICKNCSSSTKINKINSLKKNDYHSNFEESENETKFANCSTCGASLEVKPREITKKCNYCESNFVLNKEELSGLKPELIIPFAFDKNTAIEKFKEGVKSKKFLPNKFKKSPSFDSIHGTYISTFSFDSNTFSEYEGTLAEDTTYRDSDGNTHTHTTFKHIRGNKQLNFENFIIESSNHANQFLFEQITPFEINESTAYEYNPDFIRGYDVESYEQNLTDCKVLSEQMMKERIKRIILSSYRYDRVMHFSMSTSFTENKYSYILVPVYFININYKNKNYTTYLNGQTGKLGQNLPKSGVKIFFAILLPILLFALIFGLFFFFGSLS